MNPPLYINSFQAITSTGNSAEEFWQSLCKGKIGLSAIRTNKWPSSAKTFWQDQPFSPIACQLQHSSENSSRKNALYFANLFSTLGTACLHSHRISGKVGLIMASTKGAIEDYLWNSTLASENSMDTLGVVLEKTIQKLPYKWSLTQIVSNSCASSHAAFALAKKWLYSGACKQVLVLAGDLVGPFIYSGFQALKALSSTKSLPFQEERKGLMLGEAITGILFSLSESEFELVGVETFNESFTLTGPSPEGRGLKRCIDQLLKHSIAPDFAIAHGTATILNDRTEDHVLFETQQLCQKDFPISGTKWSVGHTLGASGSVDLIAALLSLRYGELFSLQGNKVSPEMKAKNYLMAENLTGIFKTALVTSLGFGGTNGALLVRNTL